VQTGLLDFACALVLTEYILFVSVKVTSMMSIVCLIIF